MKTKNYKKMGTKFNFTFLTKLVEKEIKLIEKKKKITNNMTIKPN